MADIFEGIYGQARVRTFLRASIASAAFSHAYLFTGPAGSNKTAAAYAFAQAILCKDKGCDTCDTCKRISRRKHPDVQYLAPEGAGGYLVSQIRDLITDASRAPIRERRKIYILDRVDLLGSRAANAFLKTLEEPEGDIVFILLGRTRESVLQTVSSRCQVVPFRHIPAQEAAGILAQNTGASPEVSRIAIESCGGSLAKAAQFLKSNERMLFRSQALEVMASLRLADDWDIVCYARNLVLGAKAPLDSVRSLQASEYEDASEYLGRGVLRRIEERNKNTLKAQTVEYLQQTVAILSSWLRDMLVVCAGTPELIINKDVQSGIYAAALETDEARVSAALQAARTNSEAITYNVSPETCIEVLLFEIREVLYGTNRSCQAAT